MLQVRSAIVVAWLSLLGALMSGPAHSEVPPAGLQGSSGPPAASASSPPTPPVVVSCDKPSSPRTTETTPTSVSVNASTAWQPRGGQVLIEVKGDSARFAGLSFLACFGWNTAQAKDYFSADSLKLVAWSEAFVILRPSEQTGIMNLGVTVPPLNGAPTAFYDRWFSAVRSTGLGLVPVADLRLIAYTRDGVLFDEVRPIGITSVPFALVVAAIALAIAILGLHSLAAEPETKTPVPGTQKTAERRNFARATEWLRSVVSPGWVLTLVQTSNGRASLSAFQILLWTLVVAVSAIYVMALSGNLINLTPGTLTLLGIAGAAGLLAAVNDTPPTPAGQPATPQVAGGVATGTTVATPKWRDLILDPVSATPDISRSQMLLFTVVSAAFVIVQVLNYYVIPDIPAGYQILVGISNGLYVGRKFTG